MGSGISIRGRLNMHDSVESEEVKQGHFGSACHPALEARRGVTVLPEITQYMDVKRTHMRGLREPASHGRSRAARRER